MPGETPDLSKLSVNEIAAANPAIAKLVQSFNAQQTQKAAESTRDIAALRATNVRLLAENRRLQGIVANAEKEKKDKDEVEKNALVADLLSLDAKDDDDKDEKKKEASKNALMALPLEALRLMQNRASKALELGLKQGRNDAPPSSSTPPPRSSEVVESSEEDEERKRKAGLPAVPLPAPGNNAKSLLAARIRRAQAPPTSNAEQPDEGVYARIGRNANVKPPQVI